MRDNVIDRCWLCGAFDLLDACVLKAEMHTPRANDLNACETGVV